MISPGTSADTDGFDITPPFNDAGGVPEVAGVQRFRDMLEGTSAEDLLNGRKLKQYELLSKLGAGAMGVVYKARNTDTDDLVAVKILDASFVRQHDAVLRFEKEARLLASANSPFITRLLDVCTDGEWNFLVAELVTGTTVAALLKERKHLSEKVAVNIAADVAEALVDISRHQIIHRDIKPDNILLGHSADSNSEHGEDRFVVKLTDFGLARHTQQTQSMALTRANTVLGTPLYMSPEQFSDRDRLDARSDVYSLGATLFAMLTGRPPFPSDDTLQLAELHRHETPPEVRTLRPGLSESVSLVVAKCLQKRPDQRYQSATDLLADLQSLQRGEATAITVHPVLPSCGDDNLQTFRFEWKLNSSPAELWPYVSNTERLNRAIGLPAIQYTTMVGADGETQRFANVRIAGMAMKWREHAFEWVEQRRMGVLREFESGPLKWFSSVVEFLPTVEGKTRLVHNLQVEGRGWFGRQFAKYKMGVETRRSLTKVYHRIDEVLSQTRGADPLVDAFEADAKVNRHQLRRLQDRTAQLQQQQVERETLRKVVEFVRAAPAQEAGHIRPLELAQRLNVPFDRMMEVLLRGVKVGLFELTWDVICPACRIATRSYDIMRMVKDHEYCEACNKDFGVDLLNSVELIFMVHSSVRQTDTEKYCIGGPAHSPHVVAQLRLKPRESLDLGVALSPGVYCIRGPQLSASLTFTVVGGNTDSAGSGDKDATKTVATLKLRLNRSEDWQQEPVLTFAEQLLAITNDCDRDVVVRVERSDSDRNVLSAAAAFSMPVFRELFPDQSLDRTQLASVTTLTLLQTSATATTAASEKADTSDVSQSFQVHLRELGEHCTHHGGTWIKIVGQGALMAFVNADDALRCAQSLHDSVATHDGAPVWSICIAVNSGPMTISMIHGHVDYLGPAVDHLEGLLHSARPNEIVVGNGVSCNPDKSLDAHKSRTVCEGAGTAYMREASLDHPVNSNPDSVNNAVTGVPRPALRDS